MEDISRISKKIIDDARLEAEKIISDAKAKADEQTVAIKERLSIAKAEVDRDTARALAAIDGSSSYESDKNRKNALTQTKIEFFGEVIAQAKQKIIALPTEEYFGFLYNVFSSLGVGENGVICFGDKDSVRLPDGFLDKLSAVTPLKRGEDVSGYGFLINYDGFTEDVMIDSMFEERRSELIHVLGDALS